MGSQELIKVAQPCKYATVVALITVPPSMAEKCYTIVSSPNWQIYFIYLFSIKYKTT